MPAKHAKPNLLVRNDTILGVCEGLSEDFGIPANLLRILFAGSFYFAPWLVVGTYLGLGAAVLVSRLAFPKARPVNSAPAKVESLPTNGDEELKIAA